MSVTVPGRPPGVISRVRAWSEAGVSRARVRLRGADGVRLARPLRTRPSSCVCCDPVSVPALPVNLNGRLTVSLCQSVISPVLQLQHELAGAVGVASARGRTGVLPLPRSMDASENASVIVLDGITMGWRSYARCTRPISSGSAAASAAVSRAGHATSEQLALLGEQLLKPSCAAALCGPARLCALEPRARSRDT